MASEAMNEIDRETRDRLAAARTISDREQIVIEGLRRKEALAEAQNSGLSCAAAPTKDTPAPPAPSSGHPLKLAARIRALELDETIHVTGHSIKSVQVTASVAGSSFHGERKFKTRNKGDGIVAVTRMK